jgi:hypothetical protein
LVTKMQVKATFLGRGMTDGTTKSEPSSRRPASLGPHRRRPTPREPLQAVVKFTADRRADVAAGAMPP